MNFSDNIIKVLDDISRRIGVGIDWTDKNIMPYLEDLIERFIQFKIYTSIFWVCLGLISIYITIKLLKKYYKVIDDGFLVTMISMVTIIPLTIIIFYNIYNMIVIKTIPEKLLIDYLIDIKESL